MAWRVWCWIQTRRTRLWPGIEGWANRWWAGGAKSSASGVKPFARDTLIHASWKLRSRRCVSGRASWRGLGSSGGCNGSWGACAPGTNQQSHGREGPRDNPTGASSGGVWPRGLPCQACSARYCPSGLVWRAISRHTTEGLRPIK